MVNLFFFPAFGCPLPQNHFAFFGKARLIFFLFSLLFDGVSSKSSLEHLLRFSVFLRKTFSFLTAFRCRKAAKATRPIPMPAAGRLKAASGDCAGLQANRPRRSRFQSSVRFSAIGTKSGIALRGKKKHTLPKRIYFFIISFAANGGTTNPHSRLTRKKRGRAAARPPRGGA